MCHEIFTLFTVCSNVKEEKEVSILNSSKCKLLVSMGQVHCIEDYYNESALPCCSVATVGNVIII